MTKQDNAAHAGAHMAVTAQQRSEIGRADARSAYVEQIHADSTAHQSTLVDSILTGWQTRGWPADLVARTLFRSTDGRSLLTYAQWTTASARHRAVDEATAEFPTEPAKILNAGTYDLYRVVRPVAEPGTDDARCFPAAFFDIGDQAAARQWVDDLLDNEEATEGAERDYPGALAANFHIAEGSGGIFLISEWASESEAVDHIDQVINPLLEQMGQATTGAGSRYEYVQTVEPG